MNRRLRFRTWDKQRGQYMEDNFLALRMGGEFALAYNTKQGLYPIPDTGQEGLGLDRFVVEQDTGLKAADGTPIFEGDIIQYSIHGATHGRGREDGWVGEVWYDEEYGAFQFGRHVVPESEFNGHKVESWTWSHSMADEIDRSTIKVLGNVHENADLLT